MVDDQGRTHVRGLVWLTLPARSHRDALEVGAEQWRLRSMGVSVSHGPLGSALVLGYSDQRLAAIRNHAEVHLPGDDEAAARSGDGGR